MEITKIVSLLITLIAAIATAFYTKHEKEIKENEKFEKARIFVAIGVRAAQQIFKESGQGEAKKLYVIDFLAKHNIILDIELIEKLIEAEVYEIKELLKG